MHERSKSLSKKRMRRPRPPRRALVQIWRRKRGHVAASRGQVENLGRGGGGVESRYLREKVMMMKKLMSAMAMGLLSASESEKCIKITGPGTDFPTLVQAMVRAKCRRGLQGGAG